MYNIHPGAIEKYRTGFASHSGVSNPQQNVLTLVIELSSTNNKLTLPIQKDGSKLLPTERRLERLDMFCVIGVQVCVRKMETKNGVTYPISEEETFANPDVFKGIVQSLLERDSVRTIFDSIMSLENAKGKRILPYSTKRHLYNPSKDANSDSSRGYIMLDIPVYLRGDESDEVTFVLPPYAQKAIEGNTDKDGKATDTFNVLVVNLFGYNATDAIKLSK
jgi:hypothetical protein